jgi:hypothetical protein
MANKTGIVQNKGRIVQFCGRNEHHGMYMKQYVLLSTKLHQIKRTTLHIRLLRYYILNLTKNISMKEFIVQDHSCEWRPG